MSRHFAEEVFGSRDCLSTFWRPGAPPPVLPLFWHGTASASPRLQQGHLEGHLGHFMVGRCNRPT
eukprot:scaffold107263_cov43-Cyclotella_meneghiniana.AAC.2